MIFLYGHTSGITSQRNFNENTTRIYYSYKSIGNFVRTVRTATSQKTERSEQREAMIIKRTDQQQPQQLDCFFILVGCFYKTLIFDFIFLLCSNGFEAFSLSS